MTAALNILSLKRIVMPVPFLVISLKEKFTGLLLINIHFSIMDH